MAKRRPHRSKKDQPTEEQLVAEHRAPVSWPGMVVAVFRQRSWMQCSQSGQRLVEGGFGAADPSYAEWLVEIYGNRSEWDRLDEEQLKSPPIL